MRALLAQPLEDKVLRDRLEQLAAEQSFDGLTWLWGPVLYQRNRTMFRPFILSHFSDWLRTGRWQSQRVPWKRHVAKALDAWLQRVDTDDDIDLFRRLYRWRLTGEKGWGADDAQWRSDLAQRFKTAATPAQRAKALAKFEGWYTLDETTALTLYRIEPDAAKAFVLKHLPRTFWGSDKRSLWNALLTEALERDEEFAYAVYRRQVPLKQWESDILRLCDQIAPPQQLDAELEKRHPQGWGLELGGAIYRVVERRKREVLPYVFRHLRDVYGHWYRSAYDKLLALAVHEQWLDLWAAILRTCARPQDYNQAILRLLDDGHLSDAEQQRRLVLLTGASREWNFPGFGLAQVHPLDEKTALKLYERFPQLVRGPFKLHISPTWADSYEKLVRRLVETNDELLLDFVASRLVTRPLWPEHAYAKALVPAIEALADYYANLKLDDAAFSRRAANVLTQVPAYAIYGYNPLIRSNRLARLLFERSARAYLADPSAVRDLVEGSEIHVQALAYRSLGLEDERARQLARENLDILLGTLLRPLQRKTRTLAFGALRNAASAPQEAKAVLERAKLALELPDRKYPKEQLLGLIADILWRYPELRSEKEQPVVYEHAGRSA